jgi:hypothetical protein
VAISEQGQWGAGIYRGRTAPDGSVYDALNALVNDEALLFKRGVSAYYSASDAPAALTALWSIYMRVVAANRVLATTASGLYALNGSLAPVNLAIGTSSSMRAR